MDYAILGPLEVSEGGRPLAVGGPKQRALLAILLLHANQGVSRDRLIDGIWGDHPPDNPGQTLDTYVSRLRKALGADRIERRRGGYAVRVEQGELDLERFDSLAAAGRYGEALEVWRGHALADLLYEPFAQHEAERLEARRVDVLEDWFESELEAGGGGELVRELEPLVRQHPLRERLIAQLMLALYRAGRQSTALEAYRRARRDLAEELGLEPGPQLQELERRILSHDPELAGALPARPRRFPRRAAVLVSGVAIVAVVAAAGIVFGAGGSGARSLDADASMLLAIGPSTRVARAAELPSAPSAITVAAGSLWLADPADQAVLRANPASGAVVDRIPVTGQPGSIAAGGGALWVASTLGGTVERIDPAGATVSQTIRLGQEHTSSIAYGHGAVWVGDATDDAVIELNARTGEPQRTLSLDTRPTSVVVGEQALWVADQTAATVSEIDLQSGQTVSTIHVGNGPTALALGAGGLWVANGLDSTVSRIDPQTSAVVATIPVGSGPSALTATGDAVWVANQYGGTVARIDPARNAVVATMRVGGQPVALGSTGGKVWVGNRPSAAAGRRGGTLVLTGAGGPASVDPAVYAYAANPQFTGLAYDSLVTFAKTSGPDGLHLVPDLAVQVPTPTAGGTLYAFRLRRGIRYSDGRLLRAADFRRALERVFRIRSFGRDDFSALVGADQCRRIPASCDLSGGVTTDDRAGTVVFHLSAPDPDFLFKLADFGFSAPLPAGVPVGDAGFRALPGTGPYRIARAGKGEIEFVRNQYFREWSHAAQPDGNPDRIVWRFSGSHDQSIRRVVSGKADWTWDLISPADLRVIRTRAPSLLHSNPIFAVEFLHLNTHAPPFDDLRVRRALNFAVDRNRIARMYGGPFVAVPTCQPLVTGLLGYRRYCPYTQRPTADGAYHGPDLPTAKRLVAASGTRGERVDVWGLSDEAVIPRKLTAYVGGVLRSLGYRVRVHLLRFNSVTQAMRRGHQMSTDGDWLPNYPAPSSYLPRFFACGGSNGNGYVCNRHLDTRMARALSDQLEDPRRAADEWAQVDHLITDEAYWVPTVTDRFIDLVSRRVRNYEFSPVWGFIADQARVR